MSHIASDKVMRGVEEAKEYVQGERKGYEVTVPQTADVRSICKMLKMTQATFSESFVFSLDAVKPWEGRRRTPEVPALAYLTVFGRNPAAVLTALRTDPGSAEHADYASRRKA